MMARKFVAENERIKRDYLIYLEQAKGTDNQYRRQGGHPGLQGEHQGQVFQAVPPRPGNRLHGPSPLNGKRTHA